MTIDLHNETVDELRSKLIESRSSRNASKTVKKSQIRRSKSRETLTSQDNESNDINFMARPATVISNTSGSSASNLSGNSNNM